MITVSTEVIQQSVITDHFMHDATNSKNIIFNRNRKDSLSSDLDYNQDQLKIEMSHNTEDVIDQQNDIEKDSPITPNHNDNVIINDQSVYTPTFEKIDLQLLPQILQQNKSGLSLIIHDTQENSDEMDIKSNMDNIKTLNKVHIDMEIVFSEFNLNKDNSIKLQITNEDITVEQLIQQTIHTFENVYPLSSLQSKASTDYEIRCIDDDDVDNLDKMNVNELDPPLIRTAKICEFVDGNTVYIAMCCKIRKENVISTSEPNYRRETLTQIASDKQSIFIRVYIPGPITESSVLLCIDNSTNTIRDLFTILNRKRNKKNTFNAQYFDFYYKHKTKQYGSISNGVYIMDLLQKELMILPKILSITKDDINENEAFQFELVKLANEAKQYKGWKIDKYRTKKKAFLLEIDRYRFVKTSLETSTFSTKKHKNQMKIPIPIGDIISVVATEKSNGHHHHHNQFTITYSTLDKNTKTKTFEMSNTQIRDEIVDKLNFLCIIRRLQC